MNGISQGRQNRCLTGGLPHSQLTGGSLTADCRRSGPLHHAIGGVIVDCIHSYWYWLAIMSPFLRRRVRRKISTHRGTIGPWGGPDRLGVSLGDFGSVIHNPYFMMTIMIRLSLWDYLRFQGDLKEFSLSLQRGPGDTPGGSQCSLSLQGRLGGTPGGTPVYH